MQIEGRQYGKFVGSAKPGETPALVNAEFTAPEFTEDDTMLHLFKETAREVPTAPFLGTPKKNPDGSIAGYSWRSYGDTLAAAERLAKGIVSSKLYNSFTYADKPMKVLGIFSKNREEWVLTDIACWMAGITNVPFYNNLGNESISWIFSQTEISTMFCAAEEALKLLDLKDKGLLPTLKFIVSFDKIRPDIAKLAKATGLELIHFELLLKSTADVILAPATPDDYITLCYTSGSMAQCKGVEISQRSYYINSLGRYNALRLNKNQENAFFSYLPLAHVLEREMLFVGIRAHAKLAFYCGNPAKLFNDLAFAQPTLFVGVPRIYSRVCDTIMNIINESTGMKKRLLTSALETKLKNFRERGITHHWFYDNFVLGCFKRILGGKVRQIISAAAPLPVSKLELMRTMLNCDVTEGYGLTESSGGVAASSNNDYSEGTVGAPLMGVSVKLVDVPEMGYKVTDVIDGVKMPRGELYVKSAGLTKGYFKDPEKTKELFDPEGWLRTGDIGCIRPNGTLRLIDRKKNMLKLQQGEYISPERIEGLLVSSKWVAQILVHGDCMESYLVAIVVAKKDALLDWAKGRGLAETNFQELCQRDELKRDVLKELAEICKKGGLSGLEVARKIYLTTNPFTVENGALTPSMKIKRNVAAAMYSAEIKKMYSEPLISK